MIYEICIETDISLKLKLEVRISQSIYLDLSSLTCKTFLSIVSYKDSLHVRCQGYMGSSVGRFLNFITCGFNSNSQGKQDKVEESQRFVLDLLIF